MVITLFLRIIPSSFSLALFFFSSVNYIVGSVFDVSVNPPTLAHLCYISQRTQMTNYACDDCVAGYEI